MTKLRFKKKKEDDFDPIATMQIIVERTGLSWHEVLSRMIKYAYDNTEFINN